MNTDHIIETAKHLISIPSTIANQPSLHEALNVIIEMLAKRPDITIERFERNGVPSLLAYVGATRPERFDVLLNGHLDVVPGTLDQFVPVVKDGRLYGRGAQDMKTAAVVMTDAFLQMAGNIPYHLGLQIVCDEETSGRDGVQLQVAQGVRTNFAIMGEHNFQRNVIYTAARGICWIEVEFTGKTAHGGYPWEGSNALIQASEFAQKVLQHYPIPSAATWGTTANIASIHTENNTFNRIPDRAVVRIDFRFTTHDDNFQNKERVTAFVYALDPGAKITQFETLEPAVEVSPSNPYLVALTQALEQTIQEPVVYQNRYGSGDGRFFAAVGCDSVEFGIFGKGPHTDEEYIEISNIAEYQQTLLTFLRNLSV